MLAPTALLPSTLPVAGKSEAIAGSSQSSLRSQLKSQLRGASLLMAASVACDIPTIPSATTITDSASSTEMAASPPRTLTPPYVSNHTRRFTVPTTALPCRKIRRSRLGGGGGDDWSSGDDGGFFGGGGDDGFGGGGGEDGPFDSDDSMGRWLQDVMLLWTMFCAWSLFSVTERMTRPKSPAFSLVVYNTLKMSMIDVGLKAQLLMREPTLMTA